MLNTKMNLQTKAKLANPLKVNSRDKLIENNLHLVHQVVNKLLYVKTAELEFDDLIGYGIIGLINAADRYEETKGNCFAAFAMLRIKGAILDHMRVNDHLSRGNRKKVKDLFQAISQLEQELGCSPTNQQIANKLKVSLNELNKVQRDASIATLSLDVSLKEDSEETWIEQIADYRETPEESCEKANLKDNIQKALGLLPEREKLVLGLYHYKNLTMKEIAGYLKVSESRACQLHNRAISFLRVKLEELYGNNL
jgi:RNA polymerase sigma factor for flagellar operon FliA